MKGYVLPQQVVILCLVFITVVNIHVSGSTLFTSVLLYVLFRLVINVLSSSHFYVGFFNCVILHM